MKGFLCSFSLVAILLLGGAAAAYSQTPVVAAGGVLNAASNDKAGQVAPGSLVSIYGTELAASLSQSGSIPLSSSLSGVSVTISNLTVPLQFVSPGQVNAQVPWEILALLPPGTNGSVQVPVVVTRNGVASSAVSFSVSSVSPGIFTTQFGVGQAIAYGNSDGIIAAPAGAITGLSTHPAKINDPTTLVILATGLGQVNPPVETGNNVTDGQLHPTVVTPTVLVGGVPAKVIFSGMTPQFVGVYQINVVIQPGTPTGDAIPLQIQMSGIATTDKVTIAVSN